MAKPEASETDPEPKQDAASEAERKREEQERSSEPGKGEEQERKAHELEELKAGLLTDETFLASVVETDFVKKAIQSERDGQVHQQTLPMKQRIEDLEARLDSATTATDPLRVKYLQLKEAGHYEEALALLEEHQRTTSVESAAVARGKREGAQDILQAVAARPEFSELTQEDWRRVYADAAAEAGQSGRSYITVEEYVSHAAHILVEKGKASVATETAEERKKAVEEEVSAQLKAAGVKKREKKGGPEDEGGEHPGGGQYTREQISKMSRAELAKIPRAERHKAMAGDGT